jgi:hypothetical protein
MRCEGERTGCARTRMQGGGLQVYEGRGRHRHSWCKELLGKEALSVGNLTLLWKLELVGLWVLEFMKSRFTEDVCYEHLGSCRAARIKIQKFPKKFKLSLVYCVYIFKLSLVYCVYISTGKALIHSMLINPVMCKGFWTKFICLIKCDLCNFDKVFSKRED